ncbi:putative Extracellular mutant protein 11 C-terminal domain-containing protein [Seiridium cardinale]|uniref:Extracellular mutant protein 11 C-terminal domain-containing protein n=1 Tax=Seiridium cardinale TaxID=138064 RepID=A0ABR2XXR3_9PEZI
MQAWVLNNGPGAKPGPGESQGYTYDHSGSPQKSHVVHSQPNPAHSAPAAGNSPPKTQPHYQSRMPIVNANANSRAVGAAAARLPTSMSRPSSSRPSHQISHSREASLNVQRNRGVSSEPLQNTQRQGQGPFWEGSTIEGSTLSETASNADSRMAAPSRMPYLEPAFKPRPRQESKRDSDRDRPPFIIGENGLIDVLASPPARRSSTPDFRARAGSKGFSQDSDQDPYVEETRYHTDLEKTPPNTLSHRGARLPLRATKRETFAERATYPVAGNDVSSPPEQAFQTPADVMDFAPRDERNHLRIPATREAHRSTVFENIDTPVASHQDLPEDRPESEVGPESVDDQLTPKPLKKSTQPLNRQLFTGESKTSKGRNSLRESSMPRPASEKRRSNLNTKKRSFDLDYDDSALAAMKYSELKSQDFDFDPARAESTSAQRPPPGTLPEKLDHFLYKDADAQSTFFTSMPMRDWDDSGDWFLEKFGDIMHRLKDARKAKRKLVDDFETEIAEREDAVRNKMYGIDQTLNELRNDGEVMMKNKELE